MCHIYCAFHSSTGIGRVAKNLLLPRCQFVDLVEQSPRLLAAAPAYLSNVSITGFLSSAPPGTDVGMDACVLCDFVWKLLQTANRISQTHLSCVVLLNNITAYMQVLPVVQMEAV